VKRVFASVVIVAVAALTAPVIGMASAYAGGGNSANAKLCQKGGWQNWVRADQTAFANEEDCVSYAAQGGTLTKPVTGSSQDACQGYGGTFTVGTLSTLWTCTGLPTDVTPDVQSARETDLDAHCIADGGALLSISFDGADIGCHTGRPR
jgi:hypothetical protein